MEKEFYENKLQKLITELDALYEDLDGVYYEFGENESGADFVINGIKRNIEEVEKETKEIKEKLEELEK